MRELVLYNYVRVVTTKSEYRYNWTSLEELYVQYGFGNTYHPYKYFDSCYWVVIL